MDPMSAVVLDTKTGTVLGEGFGAIPTRHQLADLVAKVKVEALPPQKLEREKRVLLAFDVIRCCVPKGADGGVQIGEPDSCSCGKTPEQ
jgi:hypothetical protein